MSYQSKQIMKTSPINIFIGIFFLISALWLISGYEQIMKFFDLDFILNQLLSYKYIIVVFGLIFGYLLPSIVANNRYHKNINSIFIINLFLGWTLLGWVICLAWALSSNVEEDDEDAEPTKS
jgi:hypothetical protein